MKKIIIALFILFLAFSFNPQDTYSQDTNNVLFEYQTGTWCGYCPCGHEILEMISSGYGQIVIIGLHGGGSDPWASYSSGIRGLLGMTAYPKACIGRRINNESRGSWAAHWYNQSLLSPGVSIEVTRSYNSSTRQLDATALVTALSNLAGSYKINFVLTESNIIYYQSSYSPCPPGGSNYVHKHVCKGYLNGDQGQDIFANVSSGDTASKSLNYTIPSGFVASNCDLVVFVYKVGSSFGWNNYVQQAIEIPVETPVGIGNTGTTVSDYSLSQNYPNPFNPTTNIHFSIPKDGNTSLKFYDVLGNEVATYYDGFLKAGTYNAEFNGSTFSSGVYFYKLTSGDFTETKKMLLTK